MTSWTSLCLTEGCRSRELPYAKAGAVALSGFLLLPVWCFSNSGGGAEISE